MKTLIAYAVIILTLVQCSESSDSSDYKPMRVSLLAYTQVEYMQDMYARNINPFTATELKEIVYGNYLTVSSEMNYEHKTIEQFIFETDYIVNNEETYSYDRGWQRNPDNKNQYFCFINAYNRVFIMILFDDLENKAVLASAEYKH